MFAVGDLLRVRSPVAVYRSSQADLDIGVAHAIKESLRSKKEAVCMPSLHFPNLKVGHVSTDRKLLNCGDNVIVTKWKYVHFKKGSKIQNGIYEQDATECREFFMNYLLILVGDSTYSCSFIEQKYAPDFMKEHFRDAMEVAEKQSKKR